MAKKPKKNKPKKNKLKFERPGKKAFEYDLPEMRDCDLMAYASACYGGMPADISEVELNGKKIKVKRKKK
jgi:hypothetical protein